MIPHQSMPGRLGFLVGRWVADGAGRCNDTFGGVQILEAIQRLREGQVADKVRSQSTLEATQGQM